MSKTALQIIEELATSRLEEMRNDAYNKARNKARTEHRQRVRWGSLTNIVSEASKKYPICIEEVQFAASSQPYFSFVLRDPHGHYGKFNMYFCTEYGGRVSLRYSRAGIDNSAYRTVLAEANTVDELIPALISKLADVVISRQ